MATNYDERFRQAGIDTSREGIYGPNLKKSYKGILHGCRGNNVRLSFHRPKEEEINDILLEMNVEYLNKLKKLNFDKGPEIKIAKDEDFIDKK